MTLFEKAIWCCSEIYQSVLPSSVLKYGKEIRLLLRPGDVIAKRCPYWGFGRLIPGYFTHLGIYVGEFSGKKDQVIETRGFGTYPVDFSLFLRAGSDIAVVRPNLPAAVCYDIVNKVEKFVGTPWDFWFDFSHTRRLVCSKLVYFVYKESLPLETYNVETILGNKRVFLPDHIFKKGFDVVWISPGAKTP